MLEFFQRIECGYPSKRGLKIGRRLGRDDFIRTSPFLREKGRHPLFYWGVYSDYEVVNVGVDRPYIKARFPETSSNGQARPYRPLVDTPYLFQEFARIAEQRDPEKSLLRWIAKYGLLGLCQRDIESYEEASEGPYPDVAIPPILYDDAGGPGETLDAVWNEVQWANESLNLYEAALSKDGEKLESLFYGFFYEDEEPKEPNQKRRYSIDRRKEISANGIDWLVHRALGFVWEMVQDNLRVFTYPYVHLASDRVTDEGVVSWHRLTPDRLVASWKPNNLLGAMYLQFFGLIPSADGLSHCKQCGKIISYGPPFPEEGGIKPRKPRSDKVFCSKRCQQNYHYHHRTKLKRQPQT
ncbi:MAG TPA: hypothetical protein VNA27_12520 [Rubrobacteraceae bacterium]|nr:hypothetical protein [Rubrobacteraceae bacterium]